MAKILSVSDVESGIIYSQSAPQRFPDIDMVISCGDLPAFYLDFIASTLHVPLYYVMGNHHNLPVLSDSGKLEIENSGGINLHRSVVNYEHQILLAGVEGCLRYNNGKKQYTEREMWLNVFSLVPGLFINKMRFGRYLDIFVTHAPPWQIHDRDDRAHRGVKAFRWLIHCFEPAIHLHGHVHIYNNSDVTETLFENTRIINTYGYRELNFEPQSSPNKK